MLGVSLHGQSLDQGQAQLTAEQQAFELAAEQYVAEHLKQVKAALQYSLEHNHEHSGHHHDELTPHQLDAMAKEQAHHDYIRQHMEEYMQAYFGSMALMPSEVTNTVCDNGGFEDDFLFYEGFIKTFSSGSETCTPNGGSFIPTTIPLSRRIEIIDTTIHGNIDPLIGINMVEFGKKSLRLNSQYGHNKTCDGDKGVDRIRKTFLVTEETRNFSVWYALALENPSGHDNSQPFISMHCDLAPNDDLCFDAEILKCMDSYPDTHCTYDSIDVLDWSCHRFRIPKDKVGEVASIDITIADCGLNAHFGYAYFDGFCEECEGSATGSIQIFEDDTFKDLAIDGCNIGDGNYCGTYTLPRLCDSLSLDSIVLNHPVQNLLIDTIKQMFCFDVPKGCNEFFATAYFSNMQGLGITASSNSFEVCRYNFETTVGSCNSTDSNSLSDDYYFVSVDIDYGNSPWSILRELVNPYPGESGTHVIKSGNQSGTVVLGPFYIQEGPWKIAIEVPGCEEYFTYITPPNYCSGCDVFNGFEVREIACDDRATDQSNDDQWTAKLFVPGPFGQSYTKTNPASSGAFNTLQPLGPFSIAGGCQDFILSYEHPITKEVCIQNITICPPKPCSEDTDCGGLEVYINEINCVGEDPNVYSVDLSVNYVGSNKLCFEPPLPAPSLATSSSMDITTGPLTGPQQITIKVCPPMVNCGECDDYLCIKTIYVTPPEDCDRDLEGSDPRDRYIQGRAVLHQVTEPRIFPNPATGIFTIEHAEEYLSYRVLDLTGRVVTEGKLNSTVNQISIDNREGLYFLHLYTADGHYILRRLLKL